MGQFPFMVNLGHYPNTRREVSKVTESSLGTEQFLKMIQEIRSEVEVALKKTNKVIKRKWDAKKKPEVE